MSEQDQINKLFGEFLVSAEAQGSKLESAYFSVEVHQLGECTGFLVVVSPKVTLNFKREDSSRCDCCD